VKTIAQFIREGITTPADLQAALQVAMELEFSTIPPYLCAQWSINTDTDPVAVMIQKIVVQEMFHFALAGNILTAIGGTPNIANAGFITNYPTSVLPGGIPQKLPVDLKQLSTDQLEVFMQMEFPEFPPVALLAAEKPTTIGAFYSTISSALTAVNPPIDLNAHSIKMMEAVQIKSIADAQAAIARIKGEGEGTQGSPDQPPEDGAQFAHYYVLKEIFTGKKLKQSGGKWSFSGDAIKFPTVNTFKQSSASPDPSMAFNQALSQLLVDLQACWTTGKALDTGPMLDLQALGQGLIQHGIRPEFLWAAPSVP
jgi:hypothetical protein